MFIGRERELERLNARYSSGKFECIVVYGRRRVGKTTLLSQFAKDKPHIVFPALENSIAKNMETLSIAISIGLNGVSESGAYPSYRDFGDALEAVFEAARDRRMVLIIDEYPYLAAADPSASSVLQHAIDRHASDSKLMLILCGSSMSFMERQVLGYQSPLYGRRTGSMKVEPFDYLTSMRFVDGMSAEDAATIYGLTYGIPQYLRQFDGSQSLESNLVNHMLDSGCYLLSEPDNLLKQELRKPAEYNNVIQSIASGASRLNEIAMACGKETGAITPYITNLIDLGILDKETPFKEKPGRRTIYRIKDSFFRFWYRYVPRNLPLIQSDHADIAARIIMPDLPRFTGEVYEDMCRQWLWHVNGTDRLPFILTDMGRWWGSNPRTHRQEEIDIVAAGAQDGQLLFCECKWRARPTGEEELETLRRRGALIPHRQSAYALFSKSGFTDGLRRIADADDSVLLISFADMCD